MIKPRTPPGTLELLPREQIAFQRMLDVIRRNYERFGFLPVETPVFELSDVLLTKSGGETERQVYFVQSTGALANAAESGDRSLPEMALRFDLTVPLARYVAEHEHELTFPFRRYQMQRVYRGERAQRGRFREFYQCDIDVIGKDSLSVNFDAEIPAVINSVFSELAIGEFTIKLNNRKILRGVLEAVGILGDDRQADVLREIDKADKRSRSSTVEALVAMDISDSDVASLMFALFDSCSQQERDNRRHVCAKNVSKGMDPLLCDPDILLLEGLPAALGGHRPGMLIEGIKELSTTLILLQKLGVPRNRYTVDLKIARGLDYYTGTIYETFLNDNSSIGSVCSGGRYENLASHYTKSKLPGVGISIGLSRLFWQLREAGLIDGIESSSVQALVALMDEQGMTHSLDVARRLRAAGINTEVQMEPKKIGKQFQYAAKAGIRFVVLVGEDELVRGVVTVKDLLRENQFQVSRDELASTLRVELEQSKAMV